MRRREFIVGLGSAAAWPVLVPVVGFVDGESASQSVHLAAAFRQGLSDAGYVDGRGVLIEYHWAEGRYDRLPPIATELVLLRHESFCLVGGNLRAQQGHRGRARASATISR